MKLESVYQPRIDEMEEGLEIQKAEICMMEEKYENMTQGNQILMKLLAKHQKMAEALKGYSEKKYIIFEKFKKMRDENRPEIQYKNEEFKKFESKEDIHKEIQKLIKLIGNQQNSEEIK